MKKTANAVEVKHKKWSVRIYSNRQVIDMIIVADRSIDARRAAKTQYPHCRVLTVEDVQSLPPAKRKELKKFHSVGIPESPYLNDHFAHFDSEVLDFSMQ